MANNLIKISRNKKAVAIIFLALLVILSCAIWYAEKGTNKEVPKKAIYVMNFIKGSEEY